MYPFKFKPVFQERIWGGRNLSKLLNKNLPPEKKIGESWEISAHPNGLSKVVNGQLAGKTISELLKIFGDNLMGTSLIQDYEKFPLLVKLLDASDDLSVQVHPDDDYAFNFENGQLGKTEMWYILHAEPGANIVYGLKEGVQKNDVISAINAGNFQGLLNYVPAYNGDVFFIPAGLVHALGAGLLVVEIQQDSDLTYRVFDYNRLDDSGQPRQLHIQKALDVINFDNQLINNLRINAVQDGTQKNLLCNSKNFKVEKISISQEYVQAVDGSKFFVIMVIAGRGTLLYHNGEEPVLPGDSFLIPAGLGNIRFLGNCEIIVTYI